MLELEKTYLAKELPKGLKNCKYREIVDIYLPQKSKHPVLRLRKNGERYEITKKQPVKAGDASKQLEQTIVLDKAEFKALEQLPGKKVSKKRYFYPYKGKAAEIDIFNDDLAGLVLVDVEFKNEGEKNAFELPEFCLKEVAQAKFIAGGMLCGRKYAEISDKLADLGYKKLSF